MGGERDERAPATRPAGSGFRPTSVRGLMKLVLVCGFCFGLIAFVTPLMQDPYSASQRTQCINNLKQIALGLYNYQDRYGCLPPAVVTDGRGKPMHSWRVLLLPYLEQKALYDAYNFEEPWDGPNNRRLIAKMPRIYACPSREDRLATGQTSYFAVVGPGLIFPGPDRSTRLDEITDGTPRTILVVESQSLPIAWTEPRDLDLSAMSLRVNDPVLPSISGPHPGDGANVVRADGSAWWLTVTTPSETIRAWLTIDGGEAIPDFD